MVVSRIVKVACFFALVGACLAAPTNSYAIESSCEAEITFTARTNVGFSIHGEVEEVKECELSIDLAEMKLKKFILRISPEALDTGMSVRNGHMVKHVFTSADDIVEDIVVSGVDQALRKMEDYTYVGTFNVSFRGQSQNVPIAIHLDSSTSASAKATLDISSFGVEDITLMGVNVRKKVEVEVQDIHFIQGA